jgi:hypothetical protein
MLRTALPVLLLLGTAAQAQAPSPPAQPGWPAQQNPDPNPSTPPNSDQAACPPGVGANAPTVGSGGASGPDLSDKLARSNGVICPPAEVDPKMGVPAPGGGRMPVLPPPGTPGGDQRTVPK